MEVDLVLVKGNKVTAIEVKSGVSRTTLPGIDSFAREFEVTRKLLVGAQGIPLGEFLETPASNWF
jgi:hypothetical protein